MPGTVDLEVKLPRAETAPAVARQTLRRRYAVRVDPGLLREAELLVSELTSNALRHGRGEITLRAGLDDDRLLVEVIDEGSGFERTLRQRDFEHVGGWGSTSWRRSPAAGACTRERRTSGSGSNSPVHGSANPTHTA